MISFKFSKIIFSVFVSTADRQSSSIKILGSLMIALAIDILCFCPPERVIPLSPILVLNLLGKDSIFLIKSEFSVAFLTFSKLSSTDPNKILFSIVSENKKTS